ncbi:NAD(P)-binding protein [Mycena olivaceomarginata]|nr:NAD(P)-binding protein [Mycena olivaceomarginata]
MSRCMPVITIFGATGAQGSAVLEAVLADGRYTPRGISRSLDSAGSKALIARGIEVVVANLWDKQSLKIALRGSEAVFGVTNFFDPEVFPKDPKGAGEIVQGKNLVDAAKEVGVNSLPNASQESNGIYKRLYVVDNKATIEDYLRASGIPFAVLLTGWFAENLWKYGTLEKTDAGYRLSVAKYDPASTQVFTWASRDLGPATVALLTSYADPSKGVLGKFYPVVSFRITHPEFAAAIAKGIGKDVTFLAPESAGLPEFDDMASYQSKFGMYNSTAVPNPDLVALGVEFGTLEEFVQKELVARFA